MNGLKKFIITHNAGMSTIFYVPCPTPNTHWAH